MLLASPSSRGWMWNCKNMGSMSSHKSSSPCRNFLTLTSLCRKCQWHLGNVLESTQPDSKFHYSQPMDILLSSNFSSEMEDDCTTSLCPSDGCLFPMSVVVIKLNGGGHLFAESEGELWLPPSWPLGMQALVEVCCWTPCILQVGAGQGQLCVSVMVLGSILALRVSPVLPKACPLVTKLFSSSPVYMWFFCDCDVMLHTKPAPPYPAQGFSCITLWQYTSRLAAIGKRGALN